MTNEYSKILRELRGSKTQQEIADAIGVSLSTYQKYEQGTRRPKDIIKIKISEYYNTEISKIFY